MDGRPCDICGAHVPYTMAMYAHAANEHGNILWVCPDCRQKPGMAAVDRCDACHEWKPRATGKAYFADDAAGIPTEVFWTCGDCSKEVA